MRRLSDHDSPRSWGPQSTAIPVGGGLGILLAIALLAGVAVTVPEVGFWATVAMPAVTVFWSILNMVQRSVPE